MVGINIDIIIDWYFQYFVVAFHSASKQAMFHAHLADETLYIVYKSAERVAWWWLIVWLLVATYVCCLDGVVWHQYYQYRSDCRRSDVLWSDSFFCLLCFFIMTGYATGMFDYAYSQNTHKNARIFDFLSAWSLINRTTSVLCKYCLCFASHFMYTYELIVTWLAGITMIWTQKLVFITLAHRIMQNLR